jgi:hypothetical protein
VPTKPFEPLLYRELRKVEIKELIGVISPLLQEEVNYATSAFQRCQESMKGSLPDEPLPTLESFYHVIEMTDGIDALLSQSCVIPTIPLLRSSFEALLAIEYILKEDCQRRAFSWLVCYVHNKIKLYELFDTSTQKGKDFKVTLASDGLDKFANFETIPNIYKSIENLESLLVSPNYVIAEEEYQKLKKTKKGALNWYTLFSGPKNIRELSRYSNHLSEYDLLYRGWSNVIHAGDLTHFLTKTNNNLPGFKTIRNHEDLGQVAKFASTFLIDATKLMINKYRHGENQSFGAWYMREIRKPYLSLK